MAKEIDPRLVFERLFGGYDQDETEQTRGRRQRYRQSVLDFVREDARDLKAKLGATDRRKLDEYLTGVREIEQRITRTETSAARELPKLARPDGIPKGYQDHIRLMCDLLVLAFQGDLTRVSTFVLANDGSNRSYAFIDVPEGHHDLSHHGGRQGQTGQDQQDQSLPRRASSPTWSTSCGRFPRATGRCWITR